MRPTAVQPECTIVFGTCRYCAAWPHRPMIFSDMTLLRSSNAVLRGVWQLHEFTLPELHRSAIPLAPWGAQGLSSVAAAHFRMDAWSIDSV